jgi:hypothetical protein
MYQFVSLSILQYMPLCPRKLCQTQHGCQGKSFKPESLFLGDQRAHNRKTKSPWFVKGLDEECATIWCADLGNAFENDWSAIVFHLPIDKTTHSLKNPPTILLCLWSKTENGIVMKSHVIFHTHLNPVQQWRACSACAHSIKIWSCSLQCLLHPLHLPSQT